MEFRLDRLLDRLRTNPAEMLELIDRDELLLKKQCGPLVLANAGEELFTPQAEHQLFAKGIVYSRQPYQLVSLPLIKIYNLHERGLTVADLVTLGMEEAIQIRFLRKLDGSLIQVFRWEDRTIFTTRGMIEGATLPRTPPRTARGGAFDFLGAVRELAQRKYPALLDRPELLQQRTLIFELIHPQARVVTDYGDREELVLTAVFDHNSFRYLPHSELLDLAARFGLDVIDALTPTGASLSEQIEELLRSLAGTDQEGTVLNFERPGEVIYRVKVKSPDYLQLVRLMTACTYEHAVAMLEQHPEIRTWSDFESHLKTLGREEAPEELHPFYREYFERHQRYLADCATMLEWAQRTTADLRSRLPSASSLGPREYRKEFAALATLQPHSSLLFAELEDKLDLERVRATLPTPKEAELALARIR